MVDGGLPHCSHGTLTVTDDSQDKVSTLDAETVIKCVKMVLIGEQQAAPVLPRQGQTFCCTVEMAEGKPHSPTSKLPNPSLMNKTLLCSFV